MDEEDEILVAYALRFSDEYEDFQQSSSQENLLVMVDRAIHNGIFPQDSIDQFRCFIHLQRWLFKWGGESLHKSSLAWRAFRTLFLMTASQTLAERNRRAEYYEKWEREFAPRLSRNIALIARLHTQTRYTDSKPDDEDPTSSQFLSLYHLEDYLFSSVGPWFRSFHRLSAYDLFCIVIWKANRSKSLTARRLLSLNPGLSLDEIVEEMGNQIARASDRRSQMEVLWKNYRMKLPMASAILTVLYPDDFTVFDVRAQASLGMGDELLKPSNSTSFERVWGAYEVFEQRVRAAHPQLTSLRDKDRALWAQSFHTQLIQDIKLGFSKTSNEKDRDA